MKQKLTDIETALLRVDSATFQRLADEYLFYRHGADFRSITRTGTQIGKMQTTKGTPNTYVVLPTGKYVLIEYTKQQTGLPKKLNGDIAKCLDTNFTGLLQKQIERIIIIHAGRLTTEEDSALRGSCPSGIQLEIIGLDGLAMAIHNDFRQLARRYLDIAYDPIQLETPDEFIAEQSRKAAGDNNPLANPFRHRDEDLSALLVKIEEQHVIVLTGGQGVGKTRLALEAIRLFCESKPDYEPLCISNKYASLIEDLNEFVKPKKKYVFLIDDANRQTPILLQTLAYLYAKPDVSFKIILTVRDYAFDVVKKHLQPYRWDWVSIDKFTDEQIVQLIAEEPFKIGHQGFQERIRDLSNGNPRLAIMAAKLALKEQNLFALNDATDLYINYYDNLTDGESKSLLIDPTRLKVLGLLAVFRQIDLLDESFVERLTSTFGLSRDTLVAELAGLEKDELADVYLTDQSFFRLSDQNLATYAVYQVFIEKKLLNVDALLTNFFEDYPQRIRDAFYGVINAFDQERIVKDMKLVTNQYYQSVKADDDKAYKFLNTFFVVLPTETLDYLFSLAGQLPTLIPKWREENAFWTGIANESVLKDRLRLLFNFFSGHNTHFDTALELLVHFANTCPDSIPLLVSMVQERLAFRPEDTYYGDLRQTRLLNYLKTEAQDENEAARQLLFAVLPSFLRSEFRSTTSKGRAITFTTLPYPMQAPFDTLRNSLWEFVGEQFPSYPDECRSILFSYQESYSPRDNDALRAFDKARITELIEKFLTPSSFDDCHFVNEYVRFLNRIGLQCEQTDHMAKRFRNRQYTLFLQLDWNRKRGRDAGDELWRDPEKYKAKKRDELQETFHLTSLAEIELFFDDVFQLYENPIGKASTFDNALEAILSGLAEQDSALFKQAVQAFSKRDWSGKVSVSYVLSQVFKGTMTAPDEWYKVFEKAEYRKAEWLVLFFAMIPSSSVTPVYAEKLLEMLRNQSTDGFYLNGYWWKNYDIARPTIYRDILTILTDKFERIGERYVLWYDFFEVFANQYVEADLPLLKKAYLQLLHMGKSSSGGFDFDHKNLKILLHRDPPFLIDFVGAHYVGLEEGGFGHPRIENLSFIWSLDDAVKWGMDIIRLMKSKNRFELHGHNYEPLLQHTSDDQKETLHVFLGEYIKTYANDTREIESMVQAFLHVNKYEEWLLCVQLFLLNNNSVEDFRKISWSPNSLSGSGNMNFDQERANRLKQVLNQVQQMPKRLPYLKHIEYLEWYIGIYEQEAEKERRRQFGEDD